MAYLLYRISPDIDIPHAASPSSITSTNFPHTVGPFPQTHPSLIFTIEVEIIQYSYRQEAQSRRFFESTVKAGLPSQEWLSYAFNFPGFVLVE